MATGTDESRLVIGLTDTALDLRIGVDARGMARITRLTTAGAGLDPGADGTGAGLPLLDVIVAGEGRAWSSGRYCESTAGARFRYVSHQESSDGKRRELRVELRDPVTGLRAEVCYRVLAGAGALRAWTVLRNPGAGPVTIEAVTSFLGGGFGAPPERPEDLDIRWAENEWVAESRWQSRPFRDAIPDLNGAPPRGRFGVTGTGTWSSGAYLPMGAVVNRATGRAWAWQIEHNGGWHWQTGECTHRSSDPDAPRHAPPGATGAYIALLGPADAEHHWRIALAPGQGFTTVPVTVAVSDDGFDGAIAALTRSRRAARRPHGDHLNLPVIFNDYMNTLMGDPSTARLRPLIDAAAQAGAEYFVIDAGWYAEDGQDWWDTVGAWQPSATRFPGGLATVLEHIRDRGMIPGLWLEPEVVGVNSPVARQLPDAAFFTRGGQRVADNGRYQLDLRHRAAVGHLDQVVDFVVGDLGAGYLKFDYNIFIDPGTDAGGLAPGAGLLAANRAHLDWLDAVLDRHPDLVIENCASGGMRTDYALLSRLQLQSTSDQQDHLRYPPIAAAAPAAMTPEQAGNWAYPQPWFSDDEITFTMATALLGRLYLSGHLDMMSPAQRALVAEAVRVHKQIRADIASAVPFWPLGLPRWTDRWIALGLHPEDGAAAYLTVWHRGALTPAADTASAAPAGDPLAITLPIPQLRGRGLTPRVLYPAGTCEEAAWDPAAGTLTVRLPRTPSACVLALRP